MHSALVRMSDSESGTPYSAATPRDDSFFFGSNFSMEHLQAAYGAIRTRTPMSLGRLSSDLKKCWLAGFYPL